MSSQFDIKLGKIFSGILPDLSQKTKETMIKVFPWIIVAYCGYDFIYSLQPGEVKSAFRVWYVPFGDNKEFIDSLYRLINFIISLNTDIAGFCAAYLMYFRRRIGWRICLYLPLIWLTIQMSYGMLSVLQVIYDKGLGSGLILLFFLAYKLTSFSMVAYIILYFLFQIRSYYSEA